MKPPAKVRFEAQSPGDSRSLFRLRIDEKLIAENLTAAQLHLLIGEILQLVTLPSAETIPLDELNASNDE
jgi:hypothetical protein